MTTNIHALKSLFIIILFLALGSTQAQTGKGKKLQENDEIEAMKIAFITKKLSLTSDEAQVFWPIYNQYADKLQELRKKRRQDLKTTKENFDEMTDKEVEQAVDNEIVFRQKELDIQKEYHLKFKAVLPIKKVGKLYNAEDQFKRVLLDKLKDRPAATN